MATYVHAQMIEEREERKTGVQGQDPEYLRELPRAQKQREKSTNNCPAFRGRKDREARLGKMAAKLPNVYLTFKFYCTLSKLHMHD